MVGDHFFSFFISELPFLLSKFWDIPQSSNLFSLLSLFIFSAFRELIHSPWSTNISILEITNLSLSLVLNYVPNSTPTFFLNALYYFITLTQLIDFPLKITSWSYISFSPTPTPNGIKIVLIVLPQNYGQLVASLSFLYGWSLIKCFVNCFVKGPVNYLTKFFSFLSFSSLFLTLNLGLYQTAGWIQWALIWVAGLQFNSLSLFILKTKIKTDLMFFKHSYGVVPQFLSDYHCHLLATLLDTKPLTFSYQPIYIFLIYDKAFRCQLYFYIFNC